MIQASEARIGNWIEYDNRFFQIDTIAEVFPTLNTGEFGIGVVDWNNIKPIELTEERLLQCGFEEDYSKGAWHTRTYIIGQFEIYCIDGGEYFKWNGITILYLHQLQNLYFTLTGKELEINL